MHVRLYEILEVGPNGDPASAERLSLINQADAILADPLQRARYDERSSVRMERRGMGRALSPAKPDADKAGAQPRPFAFRRFQ